MRIIDTATVAADLRQQIIDWVRSLGVEPATVLPTFGLHAQQVYLTEKVRTPEGRDQIDLVAEQVVTRPLVLDLDADHQPPPALVELVKTLPWHAI
jgi:hypothetical protein